MPRSLTTHIDSPQEVGRRLRSARERAHLSQRQLAFPGCTAAYISRLEAGARVPSLQMVNQLAARLDVSGSWLATGVESAVADPADLVEAEVALRLGELEQAEQLYKSHLDVGDPARPAALAGLGQLAFRLDRVDDAIEKLEQALALRRDNMLADPGVVDTLGRAYARNGAIESAIALYDRALDAADAAEAVFDQLRFAVLLANALIDHNEFARAEVILARVITLADNQGDPIAKARLYWSQSRLHSMQGEPHVARRYARCALEILERTENDSYVAMAYHLLATTELESGNGEAALAALERGRELFGSELTERDEARFATVEARALIAAGRPRDAVAVASRAADLLDILGPPDRAMAYVALAEVFRAADDSERAKMLLGQALDLLLDHGQRAALDAARPLAELLEADGDTAGALDVLKRATGAGAASTVSA